MKQKLRVKGAPEGKRARTRAALLEAASQIIAEEGYDQLSMDKVAARAGMTKGAIYGNFASKEDLIVEAFTNGVRRPPPALKAGGSLSEQLQIIANDLIAQGPALRGLATKLVAFQLYALTHEDMRQRVAKENSRIHARIEAWARQMLPVDQLPMSPEHFVGILHALSNGLLVAAALAPQLYSADLVRVALAMLAGTGTPNTVRAPRKRRPGARPGAPES